MAVIAELKADIPHGVVFLHDAEADDIAIPPDTSAASVTFTQTCIAAWCRNGAFGLTRIVIATASPERGWVIAYQGPLDTPSRRLQLTNSNVDILAEIATGPSQLDISVWMDDLNEPSEVWIAVPAALI